jgi:hypothetical protein
MKMSTQRLTLDVPEPLYQQLRQRAEQTRRSVEEETLDVLAGSLPNGALPADLAEVAAALDAMDDATLRATAQARFPAESSAELEELNTKQRRQSLSADEARRLADLVRLYERHMVIRARAAVVLKRRGNNLDGIAAS